MLNDVREHVKDSVAIHVLLIDGVPCWGEPGYRYGKLQSAEWLGSIGESP